MKAKVNTRNIESRPQWINKEFIEGKEYYIMGLIIERDKTFILIENGNFYPTKIDIDYFDITDNTTSKYWAFCNKNNSIKLMFQDWITVANFMNYFVNCDVSEDQYFYTLREYSYYKELIELEKSI